MENFITSLRAKARFLTFQICGINQTLEYYYTNEDMEKRFFLKKELLQVIADLDSLSNR